MPDFWMNFIDTIQSSNVAMLIGVGGIMALVIGGRIGIASQALGLGEGAVEEAIKYTKERVQFGKRISQFQNTQFQLADMHTRMEAAKYLVYSAAMKKQNHEPVRPPEPSRNQSAAPVRRR